MIVTKIVFSFEKLLYRTEVWKDALERLLEGLLERFESEVLKFGKKKSEVGKDVCLKFGKMRV